MKFKDSVRELLRKCWYYRYYRNFKVCGRGVNLSRGGSILRPEEISFGDNVFISSGFRISAKGLSFGSNIMIGPNLVIECEDHTFKVVGVPMFSYRDVKNGGGVAIEGDCWIGANVTILRDVTIGEGAIVGACSLVRRDIVPYTINVGQPSKPKALRFSLLELEAHLGMVKSKYSVEELSCQYQQLGLI